jgi:Na+/serine symporter
MFTIRNDLRDFVAEVKTLERDEAIGAFVTREDAINIRNIIAMSLNGRVHIRRDAFSITKIEVILTCMTRDGILINQTLFNLA